MELDERAVEAADLVQELGGDAFAFDPDRIVGSELAELVCGSFRRKILGQSAFNHLAQHGMQPADRSSPTGDELVMATSQQAQHLSVILELHRTQVPVS